MSAQGESEQESLEELLARLDLEEQEKAPTTSDDIVHGSEIQKNRDKSKESDENPQKEFAKLTQGSEGHERESMYRGSKLKFLQQMKPEVDWIGILGPYSDGAMQPSSSSSSKPGKIRKETKVQQDTEEEGYLTKICAKHSEMHQRKGGHQKNNGNVGRGIPPPSRLKNGRPLWPLPEKSLQKYAPNPPPLESIDALKRSNPVLQPRKCWTLEQALDLERPKETPEEDEEGFCSTACSTAGHELSSEAVDATSIDRMFEDHGDDLPSAALLFGIDGDVEVCESDSCHFRNEPPQPQLRPEQSLDEDDEIEKAQPEKQVVKGIRGLLMTDLLQEQVAPEEPEIVRIKADSRVAASKIPSKEIATDGSLEFATDLRFQWLYTDASTHASDKFVLDIFGVIRNGKVEARFLDDGTPTSSTVACSIADAGIRIDESHGVGWTCYRGRLNHNRTVITGTWSDHTGASEGFKLIRLTSVRDFYFHWCFSDAQSNSSAAREFCVEEDERTRQPHLQILENGLPLSSLQSCTIAKRAIRIEEVLAGGWRRYEGEMSADFRVISGKWLDHLGKRERFTMMRSSPSHPSGYRSALGENR